MIQTGKKNGYHVLRFASQSNRASHCHMFPHRMITVINDVFAKKKKPLDSPDKLTRLIFERQLTDIPPTVDQYITDSKSRCVVKISTDTRPIVFLTINRLLTDYRPLCRPTFD